MKNQKFEPWVFMWMLFILAFIPAVLISERFSHSMIIFWLVYLLVVIVGTYVIFRCFCMNINQSESAKKYKAEAAMKMDVLKKDMLAHWIASDGIGGSRFKHRWLLKILLNRHTSLLQSLINKQARAYASLDKMNQLMVEHPNDKEKLLDIITRFKKEMADREEIIDEEQVDVVSLQIDLMKYDASKSKQ